MDKKSLEHLRDVLIAQEGLLGLVYSDFAGVGELDAQHEKEVRDHEQALQLVTNALAAYERKEMRTTPHGD